MKHVIQFTVEVHEGINGDDVETFLKSGTTMYLCAKSGCTKHGTMVLILRNDPKTALDAAESGCMVASLLELLPT